MKKYYYMCDGGSLAIQCGDNVICIPNRYGDGMFKCYLFENEKEFRTYQDEHLIYNINHIDYKFAMSANFDNANVLDYDCLKLEQINEDNILFTLNGRYAVYVLDGKVYFVKW